MASGTRNSWLAVDVGNSQIKIGLFATTAEKGTSRSDVVRSLTESSGALPECLAFHVLPLDGRIRWDEIFDGRPSLGANRIVIVGSNQQGVDQVVDEWPDWLSCPKVIRSSASFPISVEVDEPRRVGFDRLLNAVAANRLRDPQIPSVIVSCGTATTVDLVSASGGFCGGAIMPGFTLCARALNQYTEVLPLISMDELFDLPPSEDCHPALGSNTQAAIMSGVFWGQIGAVRELVARLGQSVQAGNTNQKSPNLFLTGGGARLLVPYFTDAVHCPYLPLQGLVLAASSITNS